MFSSTLFAFVTVAMAPLAAFAGVEPVFMKQNINFDDHPFIAPGPDDVRSPCPGLNTLANHGFLSHDGKNISTADLFQAALDVYNVHPEVIQLAAKVGLTTSPLYETLSLEGIRSHDSIEHDASLSRSDFALGDNFSFNETIYETLASSNPGVDYYNGTSAGWTQKQRLMIASAANPELKNTDKEFAIRTQESALYLMVMGDVATGEAPKKFVDIFFKEERLPLEEGWTVPPNETNGTSQHGLKQEIKATSEWNATEGQTSSLTLVAGAGGSTLDINYPLL